MRLRRLIILSLVLLCSNSAWAKVTTLTGVEASYAGKKMMLQRYLDGMVGMSLTLDSCVADSSGKFSFSVDIASPIQVYIPSDVVNSFIFLEPGKNYEVKIPAFQERTLAQKLDPYYRPADVLAEIKGLKITDFNYKMMEFEDAFDFYSMKNLVYGSKTDSILESVNQMKEIFNDLYADPFQGKYMEYRFLLLMNTSPYIYQDSIIARLNNLGADVDNPAFWDIFNNLFENFIPQQNNDKGDYAIFRRLIEEGNVKFFFTHLNQRYGITDKELVELVAIKLMCDLLNQPQFEQMKVVEMLQGIGAGIASQQNRDLLSCILNQASSNFIGAPAQDFVVVNVDGKEKKLSDYFGKYIYLNFGNSALSQTQKDVEVLMRFQNAYKNDLEIMNICLYDSPEQLKRLSVRYPKMNFFVAKEPDKVKELFSFRSVPAFFLIDKDGKLLMTKGAEPTDELRFLFQKIFKSE